MNAGPIQDWLLEEDASKISITYLHLMEISAAKESTINNKTGWLKEEANFKYKNKVTKKNQPSNNNKTKYDNHSHNKFLSENSGDSSNKNIHADAITNNLSDNFFNIIENNFQNKVKPYIINLSIENKDLKFEIDTGDVHSVISKQLYDTSFNNITLLPNDISLRDYVGNDISPTGKIIVNAKYLKSLLKCVFT